MWYIGQEIVCIDPNGDAYMKIYKIQSVKSCCQAMIEVIEPNVFGNTGCSCCKKDTGGKFYDDVMFRPLDSLMKEEIEELMKVETIFGVKI